MFRDWKYRDLCAPNSPLKFVGLLAAYEPHALVKINNTVAANQSIKKGADTLGQLANVYVYGKQRALPRVIA